MSEEEDEVIALCVDCGTRKPDSQAEKDPFLNSGKISTCKYCGGPVIVTYAGEAESIMNKRRSGGIVT
jgi:NAD-dependent SIR2 family protein deacetylase